MENVFRAKFPDLQLDVRSQDAKASVAAPIEWDAVKTKSSWEWMRGSLQLIAIDCDRDIATVLVFDILKEMQ